MNDNEQKLLNKLLARLLSGDSRVLGCTTWAEHKIDVVDAKPIRQKYRRLSKIMEQEMQAQIDELLEQGIIEPADGAWSSPIVLAKRPDGRWRMCIDFRRINKLAKFDAYPIPNMDGILSKL